MNEKANLLYLLRFLHKIEYKLMLNLPLQNDDVYILKELVNVLRITNSIFKKTKRSNPNK